MKRIAGINTTRLMALILTLIMAFSLMAPAMAADISNPDGGDIGEITDELVQGAGDVSDNPDESNNDLITPDDGNGNDPSDATPAPDEGDFDDPFGADTSDDGIIYVANVANGGSDTNDGTQSSPMLSIQSALDKLNGGEGEIRLLSDIDITEALVITAGKVTISGNAGAAPILTYVSSAPLGNREGAVQVIGRNAELSLANIEVRAHLSSANVSGRAIYVGDNAVLYMNSAVVSNGNMKDANENEGGAGLFVTGNARVEAVNTTFENNKTTGSGAGIYVDNTGSLKLTDCTVRDNTADKSGAGIYAANQGSKLGGLDITGATQITGNNAEVHGSGMYVEPNANAAVSGNVRITGNGESRGFAKENAFISCAEGDVRASLDIQGATGGNIGITADPAEAYRLVSLPVNGYSIAATRSGDEAAWTYDDGSWDIRYMVRNGQPGLYLCWKTVDAVFNGVDTLTGITAEDINGENAEYLDLEVPGSALSNGGSTLTVPDVLTKNGEDYVVNLNCDPDEYRIPDADVIRVTVDGEDVTDRITYEYDVEAGTATMTVPAEIIDNAKGPVTFDVAAEKYYSVTIDMNGPLYAFTDDGVITGHSDTALKVAESNKNGANADFKIEKNNLPKSGVTVHLYEADGNVDTGKSDVTAANGYVHFTGLDANKNYYIVLSYSETYKFITRDVITLNLSVLAGQKLADSFVKDLNCDVNYDAAKKTAVVSNITSNGTLQFMIESDQDTISFIANPYRFGSDGMLERDENGQPIEATTAQSARDSLSMGSKKMDKSATTYGALATVSMTGYTFTGWYDAEEGGNLITSDTVYTPGTSARTLYAHWQRNDTTAFKVRHMVEYAESGANVRYADKTETINGVKYYLYDTVDYANGISDAVLDISNPSLALKSMSDDTITWWTLDGFTPAYEKPCFVNADGSSVFTICYNRNTYKVNFTDNGEGTAQQTVAQAPQDVKFGDSYGTLPEPTLPGYEFAGWYDGDDKLVTGTDIHDRADDIGLEAKWNARNDVQFAIRIMTQDIIGNVAQPTYTNTETIYKKADGSFFVGTADTWVEDLTVTGIAGLIRGEGLSGYHFVGYAQDSDDTQMVESDDAFRVYVIPTDAKTAGVRDSFNADFDGAIVHLFFNRNKSTVHFEQPNGEPDKTGDITYGGDFSDVWPDDPGKDGYDFDGWVDENGKEVTPDTPTKDYTTEEGDVILKPTWTARKYNLTYVPGLGNKFVPAPGTTGTAVLSNKVAGGYIDPNKVTYDEPLGTMPTASRSGYNFLGWTLKDRDEFITSDTVLTVQSGIVISKATCTEHPYCYEDTNPLYAKLAPHHYTLVFNAGESKNGVQAVCGTDRKEVVFDSVVGELPVPTLPGYIFTGWYLSLNDVLTEITSDMQWTYVYEDGAEIPVTAGWIPESYRYTFHMNDAKGPTGLPSSTKAHLVDVSISHVEVKYDDVYDGVFDVQAVRDGYTFKGWSLSTDKKDMLTADTINTIKSDATLYAIWEAKVYDVKLVMKGSTMDDPRDNSTLPIYDPTATYDAETDTWTLHVAFDTKLGALPVPVKADCVFHGWLADAENWPAKAGYGVSIHNQVIDSLPQYIDYIDAQGITLTAVLEPYFTFDPDGSRFTDDGSTDVKKILQSDLEKLGEMPEVEKDHWTFVEWQDPDGKAVDFDDLMSAEEPVVLKPAFIPNVTFDPNGGKFEDGSTEVKDLSKLVVMDDGMPEVTREGWTFVEWQTADGKTVTVAEVAEMEEPVAVIAIWQANVTFDPDGGKFTDDGSKDPKEVPSNEIPEKLPEVEKPGYTHDGWQTEDGTPVTPDDLKDVDEPVVVKPIYYANITFDANGGSVNGKAKFSIRLDKVGATAPTATREGYTFDGWFTAASGGSAINLASLVKADVPVTVYAHWTSKSTGGGGGTVVSTVTVTFDSNGGSEVKAQTIKSGDKAQKPADPTFEGHKFIGWMLDGKPYDFNTPVVKDITLKAQWENDGLLRQDHIAYIAGYPDGSVGPNFNMTRAEAAMMFYRLLKDDVRAQNEVKTSTFVDVIHGSWYETAVATLSNMGIIVGIGDNRFAPEASITRAQFAALAARFDKLESTANMPFSDVSADHWAYKYIASAAAKGWVNGYGDGTFAPDTTITRAEVVTLTNRVLGRHMLTNESLITNGMKTFTDNMDSSVWFYLAIQEATNGHTSDIKDNHEVWTNLTGGIEK